METRRESNGLPALLDRIAARPAGSIAAGVVLAVAAFVLWITPSNPPGFIRDEASIAYNAHRISETLRDQDGGLLPLYLVSFGDYKSPLFVYLLAGVFRLTGPDPQVARAVAACCGLAAVLLVGVLAYRRTRRVAVGVAVVVLGGLTPWLYELSRVAYETCAQPLVLAGLLLRLTPLPVLLLVLAIPALGDPGGAGVGPSGRWHSPRRSDGLRPAPAVRLRVP